MSQPLRIAVLGAGNLGLAQVGHLASQGHQVSLYNRSPARLAPLLDGAKLRMRGVLEANVAIGRVTADLGETVRSAELIFVDVPASAHRAVAAALQRVLPPESSACILLHPGQTFGALEFARQLELARFPKVAIGELQTALYTARTAAPAEISVLAIKREVALAAYPAASSGRLQAVQALYPQLVLEESTLTTAISNVQSFIHPAVCVFNIARLERGESFRIYREGLSAAVGECFEACDAERLVLAQRLNVTVPSAAAWFGRCYGVRGQTAMQAMQQVEAYADLMAPTSLDTRLLKEDVPTGLVPLVELCRALGIAAPNLMGLLERCRSILEKVKGTGDGERTLERLGLAERARLGADALRTAF